MVTAGAVFPDRVAAISPELLVRKCLTIQGVHNYTPEDLRRAVAFLHESHGRYPFEELVTGDFRLDSVEQAFKYAEETRAFRVAVYP